MRRPPFYRGTTCHRKWALRARPPLMYPQGLREPAYLHGSFSSVNSLCPLPQRDYFLLLERQTCRTSDVRVHCMLVLNVFQAVYCFYRKWLVRHKSHVCTWRKSTVKPL
ncbi:hypothetical protein AVEN_196693-1 [Araneus ventricosus]|uniref:Uncharacterized protein n=1 Tax=Araneus ventricosus TaxID=182803 RepID=A0A4Y2L0L2_ARAVE|nr:hypothetical protein AVEN_196693-1 [Araneus ventricosus]